MKNKKVGIFLLFLAILSLPIIYTTATTTSNETNTLTLVLKGGAVAEITYQNNTTVPIYNSTSVPFNGTIKLLIYVPHPGLVLVVNGTKYYDGVYNTTINTTTIIYADAIQTYDEVSINVIGNGSVNVLLYNINGNQSALTLKKSALFKVDNQTYMLLSSDNPFTINNDNLTTNYFAIILMKNDTLNVNFNIQNISTSNLVKINLTINGNGSINMFIDNISAYETLAYHEYNESSVFYAPLGVTIYLVSSSEFKVNGEMSNLTQNGAYTFILNVTEKSGYILRIEFAQPNITHTNLTTTTTKTYTEIENQTITVVPRNNIQLYQGLIDVALVAVIVFLVTYIVLKQRKKES